MVNRRAQIEAAIEFHADDVANTRGDRAEIRRRVASTREAFATLRQQIDAFESAVLRDFAALQARVDARLSQLDGIPYEGAAGDRDEVKAGESGEVIPWPPRAAE